MYKVFRRIVPALLALAIALGCPTATLASGASPASTDRADKLYALHLFRGTGIRPDGTPVYDLELPPTRLQGLIMLIRLLGMESAALAFTEASPFTDVSGEGARYVAYAYQNGITNGTTPTTFEPHALLSSRGYVTFLLRSLGYNEADGDFLWGEQTALAETLGMMKPGAGGALEAAAMNRGDLVDLSYAALTCPVKNRSQTLAEKLSQEGVFTWQEGQAAGVLGAGAGWTYEYIPYDGSAVTYANRSLSTSAGAVSAHVLTVNVANPAVHVKSAIVDNALGRTAPFSQIVRDSGGAAAVINANFFLSGSAVPLPVGYVMVDGKLLYGDAGVTSLGIYEDGSVRIGRPTLYTALKSGDSSWLVYEANTPEQSDTSAVLYTPAYGSKVVMQRSGWALTAMYGVITEFYYAGAGAELTIPENGYVVCMGSGYASAEQFRIPQIGSVITQEKALLAAAGSGFPAEGLVSVVSGAPALVRRGVIVTDLETGFTEARFTTQSAPRTAAGIDGAGRLLLVSVPGGATIQQMREAMLALGCVDAFNLDGGASCAMYYNGSYLAAPGRELTVTLQVFVDQ